MSSNFNTRRKIQEAMSRITPDSCLNDRLPSLELEKAEDTENANIETFLADPFTLEELNIDLRSVNPNSAPGLDQIDYNILLVAPTVYRSHLLEIFN